MAKHDLDKDEELEEFKKKCNQMLNDGVETAKAVGQVAGEKIDAYMKVEKKHWKNFVEKASKKIAEEKDNVAKKKEVIHKEREEEKILRNIDEAESLLRLSQEASERAHIKYLEVLEALSKKKSEQDENDKE